VGKSGNVTAACNRSGILMRLRKDERGNTIAMMAMGLLVLAGLGGSAVDVGRTYLVKTRLQQACDAGVLAGRRAMTTAAVDPAVVTQATNFFNQNFGQGNANARDVSFTPTAATGANAGQITATATATVPMSVMQLFGKTDIPLTVNCDARLEVSNTDVMLVLDVTGSMARCPDDTQCNSGPGSKIVGLREAVLDFYDTVTAASGTNARFRLGFVPYSSAVNVGVDPFTGTNILPTGWMVTSHSYQSRVANMDLDGWTGTTAFGSWNEETFGSAISNTRCNTYGNNGSFSGYNPAGTTDVNVANSNPNNTQAPATTYSETQPTDVRRTYERVTPAYSNNSTCKRRWRSATTTYVRNGLFAFSGWDYKPVTYNVSNFAAGASVQVYTASAPPSGSVTVSGSYNMVDLLNAPGSTVTGTSTTYDGCVEERDTVAQSTYSTIPTGAYDLDVITTPFDDSTRWRPMWSDLVYNRSDVANELNVSTSRSPNIDSWCPAASSKLAVRDRASVEDYTDSLIAVGNTFHDLGMAWGVRLIAPTGLFASENTTAPNGRPISRHIIFMTDGDMYTPTDIYTPHGYEKLDRRVTGAGNVPNYTDLENRHNARFQALCNAARNNNITVWTVAFGTSNPPTLVSCADPGRSFSATDTATLRANFQQIASQIAELRLSR
jgi:Flp pilus assembly protein TadG